MFILPTPEAVQGMLERLPEGPFVMLNLHRLRDVADYSANPALAPETPVTGRRLFDRYAAGMERHLAVVGAKRVFLADGGPCLIGLQAFLDLSTTTEMQAELPHRYAMLEDSRVIPMVERSLR